MKYEKTYTGTYGRISERNLTKSDCILQIEIRETEKEIHEALHSDSASRFVALNTTNDDSN